MFMNQLTDSELDTLILEEKHKVAEELFADAWATGIQEGIEPAVLAEAAMTSILTCLSDAEGDAKVSGVVEALPQRVEFGHFTADRVLQ